MIDFKKEIEDLRPINLELEPGVNHETADDYQKSVLFYNKALESIKARNEDMAIIELKKALAANGGFQEAWLLLGLCYAQIKDLPKAAEAFQKVTSKQAFGAKAQLMLGRLQSETIQNEKTRSPFDPNKINKKKIEQRKLRILAVTAVVCFAAGLLLAFMINLGADIISRDRDEVIPQDNTAELLIKEQYDLSVLENQKLSKELELVKKDLDSAKSDRDRYIALSKLDEAQRLMAGGEYFKAADILLLMSPEIFKDETLKRFDELKKQVLSKAAAAAYDNGYRLYNTRNYEEALTSFNKVQGYDAGFVKMDAVLYYTGRCSQRLNDSRGALATFQKLIDLYPKSSYIQNALARIKELTELP